MHSMLMEKMPEHASRIQVDGLHPEVRAAYDYIDRYGRRMRSRAQDSVIALYQEWAVREAFLAGITFATERAKLEGKA